MSYYRFHRFISNVDFFRSISLVERSVKQRVSAFRGGKIIQIIIPFFMVCCLLIYLLGCEAFTKKFVRKPKKAKSEEPVLVPEDYSLSDIPVEERYRQHFLFWKSWQDELITALGSSASHKRRVTCLKEAIKNLEEIRPFLYEEKQKQIDVYLQRLHHLESQISKDIYGAKLAIHRSKAEVLKRDILRDLSYPKVENHLR